MSLPKPKHPGAFHGHCRSLEIKVDTGRRFPWTPPGRAEPFWLKVMEAQLRVDWVWDTSTAEWLSTTEWAIRYPSPNAGQVTVSKHDFGPLAGLKKRLAARQRQTNIADKRARRKRRKGGR